MTKWVVFDLEADGLDPTKIYCLSGHDSDDNIFTLTDYDDMRRFFQAYDVYVGHFVSLFDIPVCERLLDIKVSSTVIDTLAMSWYLFPKRKSHGLEDYGEEYGIPKPVIDDWHSLSLEEYIHRCEEDVKINHILWIKVLTYLVALYPDGDDFWKFVRYMQFKMDCLREQEEEGWEVDVSFCLSSIEELEGLEAGKVQGLSEVMPKVPVTSLKKRPKVLHKKDGSLSSHGLKWTRLLTDMGLRPDTEEVLVVTGEEEPNPGSHGQLKSWLYDLGWEPQTFKYDGDRAIPQINLPHGEGICPSIKALYEKEPNLELLDSLFVIRHRISLLKGFVRDQRDGKLKARAAGLTNTLRLKHSEIVNLPKVNVAYGKYARHALVCPEGFLLCGSDMASLEDRLKQHYIYPYDPEYVETMLQEGFDPHLDLAVLAGKITEEEAEAYKKGDKSKKKIRDIFKNGNYACQYGAGWAKLMTTCGISALEAKQVHKIYWERNWSVKQCAKDQKIVRINDEYLTSSEETMWLVNPVSGFLYSLRFEKDVFSTLVQGTASYVFDLWLGFLRKSGVRLMGQFHDEKISKHPEGTEEEIEKIHRDSIVTTNSFLGLNRRLDIDVQFGKRYSEIH